MALASESVLLTSVRRYFFLFPDVFEREEEMRSTGRISYFIRVTIKVNSDSILCFSRSRRASGTKFLTVSSATKLIKAVVGKECLNLVFLGQCLRQGF